MLRSWVMPLIGSDPEQGLQRDATGEVQPAAVESVTSYSSEWSQVGLWDWQKKLTFLLTEQATAVSPNERFALEEGIAEARARIAELSSLPQTPDAYRCMAVPPNGFVERHQLNEIVALLETADSRFVTVTTVLRGPGGFGKTTLAQALAYDDRVRRAYPDGVLWTTMGNSLKDDDRVSRVLDLIRFWSHEETPPFHTASAAGAYLREVVLAGQKVLLVVDDVWSSDDFEPFRGLGAGSALLITTRNRHTLPSECEPVDVNAMRNNEAVELLASGLAAADTALLGRLAERLGSWPLLLKLVSRRLRTDVHDNGLALPAAIEQVEAVLARGLEKLEVSHDAKREEGVRLTMQVSLDVLSSDDRSRYLDLAVFPADKDVPVTVAARLWKHDVVEANELCKRLADLSLLLELDLSAGTFRLHDVFREYLLGQHEERRVLHRAFLDRCRPPSRSWTDLAEDDLYLWRYLADHLVQADMSAGLRKLLFDFAYLRGKLAAVGVNALMSDYDFFPDDGAARLVQGALRLSSHVLVRNSGHLAEQQLAGQLLGRLMGREKRDVRQLVEEAAKRTRFSPKTASLTQTGGPLLRTLEGHTDGVGAVAVLDRNRVVSASLDRTLRVWDVESGEITQMLEGHTGEVIALAVLDKYRVASASFDRTLRVWNVETGDTIRILEGHSSWVLSVATLDANHLVSGSDDQTLRIWDVETGETTRILKGHNSGVTGVTILDEHRVVSASIDQTFRVWSVKSDKSIAKLDAQTPGTLAILALDKNRFVATSDDQTLRVWNVASGQSIQTLEGHTDSVNAVAVLDENTIVSVSDDQTLRVWDVTSGETIKIMKGHADWVRAIAVLDKNTVVSGSYDTSLRIWNVASGDTQQESVPIRQSTPPTPKGHAKRVSALVVLDEGRVVSASEDRTVGVWDIESGQMLWALGRDVDLSGSPDLGLLVDQANWISAATLDKNRIVIASSDKNLLVWNVKSGETVRMQVDRHQAEFLSVATVNKNRVVSASTDKALRVWDVESGELLRTLVGHKEGVMAVAVLDESRVVSASWDFTLRVWDVESGERLRTLTGHTDGVMGVAVLDKNRVVSASWDRTVRVWDVESGEMLRKLESEGHASVVHAMAVVDQGHIISASTDKTLRVWDVESGRDIAIFNLDVSTSAIAFAPERRIVIAGDETGGIHFLSLGDTSELMTEVGKKEDRTVASSDDSNFDVETSDTVRPAEPDTKASTVTAILVTAITRERRAALEELRAQEFSPVLTKHDGRYHHSFTLERPGKDTLSCLVAQPSEKGPHATQALTSDLLRTFQPELVLLVGVAGGLDERGVGEGDVIVARRVYNYEPGRLKEAGLEGRPEPYRCSARVVDLAQALSADGTLIDVLQGRKLHVKDYASGEKVVMDRASELRQRIMALAPDLFAFEMEGHGLLHSVWEAARGTNVQCGVVKCISDFGDAGISEGKAERQRTASRRSVQVALELLRNY